MSAIRKTQADIRREDVAAELSRRLGGTGISVLAGGRKGPYTLMVERLGRAELEALIAVVLGHLGAREEFAGGPATQCEYIDILRVLLEHEEAVLLRMVEGTIGRRVSREEVEAHRESTDRIRRKLVQAQRDDMDLRINENEG